MQTETKNNVMDDQPPPLPPEPHFDAIEVAAARQVQPLSEIRGRRFKQLARSITRGHVSIVAALLIAFALSFGLTVGFMIWEEAATPASAAATEAATQPATEPTQDQTLPSDTDQVTVRRHRPKHRARLSRPEPTFEFDDEGDDDDNAQKPKARLVSIIH